MGRRQQFISFYAVIWPHGKGFSIRQLRCKKSQEPKNVPKKILSNIPKKRRKCWLGRVHTKDPATHDKFYTWRRTFKSLFKGFCPIDHHSRLTVLLQTTSFETSIVEKGLLFYAKKMNSVYLLYLQFCLHIGVTISTKAILFRVGETTKTW